MEDKLTSHDEAITQIQAELAFHRGQLEAVQRSELESARTRSNHMWMTLAFAAGWILCARLLGASADE